MIADTDSDDTSDTACSRGADGQDFTDSCLNTLLALELRCRQDTGIKPTGHNPTAKRQPVHKIVIQQGGMMCMPIQHQPAPLLS
jgi:hypothetical protein